MKLFTSAGQICDDLFIALLDSLHSLTGFSSWAVLGFVGETRAVGSYVLRELLCCEKPCCGLTLDTWGRKRDVCSGSENVNSRTGNENRARLYRMRNGKQLRFLTALDYRHASESLGRSRDKTGAVLQVLTPRAVDLSHKSVSSIGYLARCTLHEK